MMTRHTLLSLTSLLLSVGGGVLFGFDFIGPRRLDTLEKNLEAALQWSNLKEKILEAECLSTALLALAVFGLVANAAIQFAIAKLGGVDIWWEASLGSQILVHTIASYWILGSFVGFGILVIFSLHKTGTRFRNNARIRPFLYSILGVCLPSMLLSSIILSLIVLCIIPLSIATIGVVLLFVGWYRVMLKVAGHFQVPSVTN